MRWKPVAPLGVAHCTTEDDVYGGYFIPKGELLDILPSLSEKEFFLNMGWTKMLMNASLNRIGATVMANIWYAADPAFCAHRVNIYLQYPLQLGQWHTTPECTQFRRNSIRIDFLTSMATSTGTIQSLHMVSADVYVLEGIWLTIL